MIADIAQATQPQQVYAREEFVYDTPLNEGDSSKWFAGAVYQFTGRDHTDRLLECAVTETDEIDQLLS